MLSGAKKARRSAQWSRGQSGGGQWSSSEADNNSGGGQWSSSESDNNSGGGQWSSSESDDNARGGQWSLPHADNYGSTRSENEHRSSDVLRMGDRVGHFDWQQRTFDKLRTQFGNKFSTPAEGYADFTVPPFPTVPALPSEMKDNLEAVSKREREIRTAERMWDKKMELIVKQEEAYIEIKSKCFFVVEQRVDRQILDLVKAQFDYYSMRDTYDYHQLLSAIEVIFTTGGVTDPNYSAVQLLIELFSSKQRESESIPTYMERLQAKCAGIRSVGAGEYVPTDPLMALLLMLTLNSKHAEAVTTMTDFQFQNSAAAATMRPQQGRARTTDRRDSLRMSMLGQSMGGGSAGGGLYSPSEETLSGKEEKEHTSTFPLTMADMCWQITSLTKTQRSPAKDVKPDRAKEDKAKESAGRRGDDTPTKSRQENGVYAAERGRTCYACGEKGHLMSECTLLKKVKEENKKRADTPSTAAGGTKVSDKKAAALSCKAATRAGASDDEDGDDDEGMVSYAAFSLTADKAFCEQNPYAPLFDSDDEVPLEGSKSHGTSRGDPSCPQLDGSDDENPAQDVTARGSVATTLATRREVMIDSGAGICVFGTASLLSHVRPLSTNQQLRVTGVTGAGLKCTHVGRFLSFDVEVYYSAESTANLLSMSALEDSGVRINMQPCVGMLLQWKGEKYLFPRSGKFWSMALPEARVLTRSHARSPGGARNMRRVSANRVSTAREPVNSANTLVEKSKSVEATVPRTQQPALDKCNDDSDKECKATVRQQEIKVDIFHLSKDHSSLLALFEPSNMMFSVPLEETGGSKESLLAGLRTILAQGKSVGLEAHDMYTSESAFTAATDDLAAMGLCLDKAGAGERAAGIEREIRNVKTGVRGITRKPEEADEFIEPRPLLEHQSVKTVVEDRGYTELRAEEIGKCERTQDTSNQAYAPPLYVHDSDLDDEAMGLAGGREIPANNWLAAPKPSTKLRVGISVNKPSSGETAGATSRGTNRLNNYHAEMSAERRPAQWTIQTSNILVTQSTQVYGELAAAGENRELQPRPDLDAPDPLLHSNMSTEGCMSRLPHLGLLCRSTQMTADIMTKLLHGAALHKHSHRITSAAGPVCDTGWSGYVQEA